MQDHQNGKQLEVNVTLIKSSEVVINYMPYFSDTTCLISISILDISKGESRGLFRAQLNICVRFLYKQSLVKAFA